MGGRKGFSNLSVVSACYRAGLKVGFPSIENGSPKLVKLRKVLSLFPPSQNLEVGDMGLGWGYAGAQPTGPSSLLQLNGSSDSLKFSTSDPHKIFHKLKMADETAWFRN